MHEGVLSEGVAQVASSLGAWPAMAAFYLSGGTGLALHLGHRQSRDLDFFTTAPLPSLPALAGIDGLLQAFASVEWVLNTSSQVQWRLNGVSVSLVAYPFGHSFPHRRWGSLNLADARDIAIQKAYTVGRRARARDYLDLHAVLTSGVLSLGEIVERAQHVYGEAFSPRLFLQQLTYTADLVDRDDALSLLTTPRSFESITSDLDALVRQWGQERFGGQDQP